MNPRAVIFDMDGLLMDSERVGLDVMRQCGKKQGYDLSRAVIRQTLGANKQFSSDFYHGLFPALDTEKLFLDFKEAMCDLARAGGIPLKKGARALLEEIKKRGLSMAVASSSGQSTIAVYLDSVGVTGYFDALVSGAGLPSKPAPDVFLQAAKALHAAPDACLVLEDSVHGVQAGRNAGMTVCMVPDMIPFREELRPFCDYVLPDLAAAVPLLGP